MPLNTGRYMSISIPNVSFPLQGNGSTAPVRGHLPLRLIELSGCTINRGWGSHDMTAPTWRLYFDLDDGAAIEVRGSHVPLSAGHLYIVPAWLRWSARCLCQVRHFNAMLDLPSLSRERVLAACTSVVHLAGPGDPLAAEWLACASMQAERPIADLALLARGHAAVWAALSRYFALLGPHSARLIAPAPDQGFERLRHWVEERLDQPLPRAALAHAVGCSEAELSRRFAADLGTSPVRWLRNRRVAYAAELLRSTDLAIEAVAARCGLGDRSQFSKTFARVIGCGPGTFRRRM